MEIYRIENLTFKYPLSDTYALDDVSIGIKQGDFLVICGTSGSGKTTLLRMLKPALSPHGKKEGRILFNGCEAETLDEREAASKIGFVMQNPENQIACDKVWHELAFGAESLGMKQSEIRAAVAETASFFGIENWFYKNVNELSGGQKQILNLASVMVTKPSVIILDEPTSQLDPVNAQEFLSLISRINREMGITVILTEHRLEEALSIADCVMVMEKGKPVFIGKPCDAAGKLTEISSPMFDALPVAMRVFDAAGGKDSSPVTIKEGRDWLLSYCENNQVGKVTEEKKPFFGETVLSAKNVYFRYGKNETDVLKDFSINVKEGEFYAILGGNGTGKTTALSVLCGINKHYRGEVDECGKRVSMLVQNPRLLFTEKSVEKELYEVLDDEVLTKREKETLMCEVVSLCRLDGLLARHPYDLSGGEMQRSALAKILLKNPDILLLDEPTKGMDAGFKKEFAKIISELKASGKTIVMVSHDVEFCAEYADRCAMFFDGNIVSENYPREFFNDKNFYTTAANRMSRGIIENAVLPNDIVQAIKGKSEEKKVCKENKLYTYKAFLLSRTPEIKEKQKKGISENSTLLSILMLAVIIPLTVIMGKYVFDDRKYYFISLLIIVEITIPFLLSFEKKKPAPREIVVIATLCALTAAGRIALFPFPQFKPMAALVIITGMCFGAESGFLVGAISVFASNFFLSQGPWTPWQMFGFGMIGFLSGLVFKGILKKSRFIMAAAGFAVTLICYGPIVNFGNVMMIYPYPTWELFKVSMITGLPFDIIHAVSTMFFLVICGKAIAEKLERLKNKYGIMK